MRHSKIQNHKLVKGKFITPFNTIAHTNENPWFTTRLPEYLWIGLIFKKYGREISLRIFYEMLQLVRRDVPELSTLKLSEILSLPAQIQGNLYRCFLRHIEQETLSPLTILITLTVSKQFSETFYCNNNGQERLDLILSVLKEGSEHQSDFSTDIRFVVLMFSCMLGKIYFPENIVEKIKMYPLLPHSNEEMRYIRPIIRATELTDCCVSNSKADFINFFWERISSMTDCAVFCVKHNEESKDVTVYASDVYKVYAYIREVFLKTDPLNEKMNVILSLATYAYKRFKEICDYKLFNAISGRSNFRVIIETYINIKYLIFIEESNENVWKEYQLYGIGAYKFILSKYRERDYPDTQFNKHYIEALVNEYKYEEFIDIDTNYFNKHNIRKKAELVDEKDLYDFYYDYCSSFEHGLWGAVRESSLLKCNNPAHQYHCVPDIDLASNLSSVLPDLVMIMNKIISLLDTLYGIPQNILEKVIKYEA